MRRDEIHESSIGKPAFFIAGGSEPTRLLGQSMPSWRLDHERKDGSHVIFRRGWFSKQQQLSIRAITPVQKSYG